jgi:glyoxylase-like metal-dependent hydrolase (beta-lactamase superfamily II)
MSSQLHFDVSVPYKPIAGQMTPMGHGEATRPATCVSLISGEYDAVVIDADLAPTDCGAVVTWVRATGQNLTTIYITAGHGGHFFGMNTIPAAFPAATAGPARTLSSLMMPPVTATSRVPTAVRPGS